MTQQEISKRLGISLRTYQRLESGNAPLDMETMYKISKIYGLSFNALTSPELDPNDCKKINFFSTEEEIYSHPEVDDDSLRAIKKGILNPESGKIRINNSLIGELTPFQESSSPLFISDIKTTVVNRKLLHTSESIPENPWDLSKNTTSLSNYLKAWEISLRDQMAGFFLLSEGSSKFLHQILKPDQENVVILGQVIP